MKPYKIEITMIGLPKSMNGSHGHWRAAAARRKEWRTKTAWNAIAAGKPKAPLTKCRIECVRCSSSQMDFDNLVASFKGCIDGLRDAGIIADDTQQVIVERKYLWEKASKYSGRIIIRVEACEDLISAALAENNIAEARK